MSETVYYKGKLIKLQGKGNLEEILFQNMTEDIQDKYIAYISKWGYDDDDLELRVHDFLFDEYYQQYYIKDNNIWKVEKEMLDDYDIFNATKISDDEINFEVMYYNGGCSFSEALSNAINRM